MAPSPSPSDQDLLACPQPLRARGPPPGKEEPKKDPKSRDVLAGWHGSGAQPPRVPSSPAALKKFARQRTGHQTVRASVHLGESNAQCEARVSHSDRRTRQPQPGIFCQRNAKNAWDHQRFSREFKLMQLRPTHPAPSRGDANTNSNNSTEPTRIVSPSLLLACCSLIYNSYYDTGGLGSPPRRATASAG